MTAEVGTPITADALVERAAAMVPTLRERSAACEDMRRIPPETVTEFVEAGFHRIAQPVGFGGLGFGIDTVTDVALEFGRGCCSTAWMAGQWPGHNFMIGYFPEKAQGEYWADSFDVLSSTASARVRLDIEPVAGGLQVSAHMKFSSGCDAADWILLFAPPMAMCLVPKSDFRIEDDWFTMGLRGTGSKSVMIDDAFVPEHRIVEIDRLVAGTSPGRELYPDNPYYGAPMSIVLNTMLLSPTIGMARGLLELFEGRAQSRIDTHTFQPAAHRPGTQLRFAEASAEVDGAHLFLRRILADIEEWGAKAEPMPRDVFARVRRDVAYATKLCLQAADRLLESGDASGMYDEHLVQRWARDIHMAGLQFMLTWDEPALAWSQIRWGQETQAFTS